MSQMDFDQQICREDNDRRSLSNSNEDDEELNEKNLRTSNISYIDDVWFDSNVVKSINEQVNSVIQSITINKDDDHVVPRRSFLQMIIQSSFPNKYPKEGSLLNSFQWKKLFNWNVKSNNDQWNLLYKGSRDGFNAKDFHRLCDNKGPTITVIRTSIGNLFGGYTRISWHSDKSHFQRDSNAFLFSFSSNSSIKYSLIDRNSKYAVWNAPNYGPTFGRGADLFVCSQCNIVEESYSKLPSSYRDPTGLGKKALAGQQTFFIEDIEIYH